MNIQLFKSFEEFYDTVVLLTPVEDIEIKDIGTVSAKVDTGNDGYNVLHGIDIDIKGDKVSFTTIDNLRVTDVDVVDHIVVNVGAGNTEDRPVVLLTFTMNGDTYEDIKFSIGNRDTNNCKCLLGRQFLKNKNILVQA